MTTVSLGIAVAALAAIFSLWLAFAGVIVVWFARRTMRLCKMDPEAYGGYKTALVVLALTLTIGGAIAGYGLGHIRTYLYLREISAKAQTQATMWHQFRSLYDYQAKNGSFPTSPEAVANVLGGSVQTDQWAQPIQYKAYSESGLAATGSGTVIQFDSFELRSAGPDGKLGTADDIVMRTGVLCSDPTVLKQPIGKDSTDR
ncbi:MAG TPA: hypothetical protein VJX67_24710 [Blastocatellia bacterium]|nr:hypothetical protein [Blastocatellia bacterium]